MEYVTLARSDGMAILIGAIKEDKGKESGKKTSHDPLAGIMSKR